MQISLSNQGYFTQLIKMQKQHIYFFTIDLDLDCVWIVNWHLCYFLRVSSPKVSGGGLHLLSLKKKNFPPKTPVSLHHHLWTKHLPVYEEQLQSALNLLAVTALHSTNEEVDMRGPLNRWRALSGINTITNPSEQCYLIPPSSSFKTSSANAHIFCSLPIR